jgi:NAD(P)-dependent dehydrogenase (short-subunit alcohol dehydrogenase family)
MAIPTEIRQQRVADGSRRKRDLAAVGGNIQASPLRIRVDGCIEQNLPGEVFHVVNAVAPFILNARLKPLMERVPTADKHIVNVSAMEGQFYRTFKSDRHPHTNMAKASLNMMTRTSAADYIESGIHMNSVDTGWVTDEDPAAIAQMKRDMHRFHPPLDIVDGAARIVDPIFDGLRTGKHVWGQFLKDYRITDW